jgi:hypothetical protein
MGQHDIKNLLNNKKMLTKLKRLPQKGRKSLPAVHDKGLISRIYREFKRLDS